MPDKLEEMRSKLGVSDLDEGSKKQIFQKFVDGGGKVVDLNKKKMEEQLVDTGRRAPRIRQGEISDRNYDRTGERGGDRSGRGGAAGKSATSIKQEMKSNPVNKMIERFSARLSCFFGGITNFSANQFKSKFIDILLEKYQNHLLEARMVMASVLSQGNMVSDEIKKRFMGDPTQPYYELMFRFYNIYKESTFSQLNSLRDDPGQVQDMKDMMIEIYKPLYLMKPYGEFLKGAVEKALLYEKELRRMNSDLTYSNFRKVANCVDFIMHKLYPTMFALVDYYYKTDCKTKEVSFKDYLRINNEDMIGYFMDIWSKEMELEAKAEQRRSENERDEDGNLTNQENKDTMQNPSAMPETLRNGMSLMKNYINFSLSLRRYREKKDLRSLFAIRDKVFVLYAIIEFFDQEYSLLFSTNKVIFNVVLESGTRIDMKKELTDIYYTTNGLFEGVNEYLKVIREIRKVETDTYIPSNEKSSRLNQSSIQRSQISRLIRKDTKELFDKFSKGLLYVLNDYQSEKRLIQNPEEILEFNKKLDGERVIQGKKIIDAIREAYYLSYTIHFLLGEGDLGGNVVLVPEKPLYLNIQASDDDLK